MGKDATRKIFLPNSKGCFVCGEDNHAGLKTRFYIEDDCVKAKISPQRHHCSYEDVTHGGVVAALLDECMGWAAARVIERMCVTAELRVRYLVNVPPDEDLQITTEVTKFSKRLVLTTASLTGGSGVEYARADAKFTPLTVEQTLEADDQMLYRGGEARLFDRLREMAEAGKS